MTDSTGGGVSVEGVERTPAQLNEVIMQGLSLLEPALERVLCEMVQLRYDLANGMVHWDEILERAALETIDCSCPDRSD